VITATADVSPGLRRRYVEAGLWATDTIPSLLARNARERPEADAVVDDHGTRLTYAELQELSSRLAAALAARGVRPADTVGVQLPNRAEASVVACAIEKLGCVVNPLVPMYRERELIYAAQVCDTRALVVPGTFRGRDFDEIALRVAEAAPTISTIVSLADRPAAGVDSYAALLAEDVAATAIATFDASDLDADAIGAVLFTSGTEAAPKGALHSHNTLLANNRALAQILDLSADDHVFMASPVGHGTGYGFGIRLAIFLGSKLVLQETWEPAGAARLIAEERCAYTHGSTPFAHDLLGAAEVVDLDLSSLRYFVTGGASVPRGFVRLMNERVGCLLLRLYGQTEAFMTTLNRPSDSFETLETRDGRAVAGVDFEIWDDGGNRVAAGEVGEAVCRGPHRCLGFLNHPERTNAAIDSEGWLRMGDLCTIDDNGYVTVVGRKKEIINRGGYKYSPREVEDLLALHPAVWRVAIVRMQDERLGERACAFIVPRGDTALDLKEVVAYLRAEGVAPFKWPERLEFVDELPMTPSGKVQKFVLERRLAAERHEPAREASDGLPPR
jgi:non-ribosomal peptide synthetase component E (peptide arylation enzyme)